MIQAIKVWAFRKYYRFISARGKNTFIAKDWMCWAISSKLCRECHSMSF